MKNKKSELEVDFIGGGRPLTDEDEIAISNFIRAYKARHSKRKAAGKRTKIAITKTLIRRRKATSVTK
jgi:hypothetical protein